MKKREEKCVECGSRVEEQIGIDPLGFPYKYWKCIECEYSFLDMEQLEESAKIYRKLKKTKLIKMSKWGTALAIRIPKEIADKQKLKAGFNVRIIPEKFGFRVVPERD